MNKRLIEISKQVDNFINLSEQNIISNFINKYPELIEYKFIKSNHDFINLKLKGSIKYINKIDNNLRYGGMLIKTFNKNNKYYAIIKNFHSKTYKISFDNNYIFYLESRNDLMTDWMKCFISDVDAGKYNLI